jgi:hypothetical protein
MGGNYETAKGQRPPGVILEEEEEEEEEEKKKKKTFSRCRHSMEVSGHQDTDVSLPFTNLIRSWVVPRASLDAMTRKN